MMTGPPERTCLLGISIHFDTSCRGAVPPLRARVQPKTGAVLTDVPATDLQPDSRMRRYRISFRCQRERARAIGVGAGLALLVAGCATMSSVPTVSPAEIPRLEARLEQWPNELPTMLRLGAAYREAGRLNESRTLLESVRQRTPTELSAAVQLGLTYEAQGFYGNARALYQEYIDRGPSPQLRDELRGRMPQLRKRELEQGIRDALRRESQLAAAPAPFTVGVFPFSYFGANPSLAPLDRALAELLTTDLGQVERLTVLERVHVQVLLDELALSASQRVDESTAARSGRILGAGRIVQGRIDGGEESLQIQALVVGVGSGQAAAPVSESDALPRLFDLEKRLALAIIGSLGIELTPAERERINRRYTENLQALLAFGLGLEASDRGDYRAAAQHFAAALALDPGFELAREHAGTAQAAAGGAGGVARLTQLSLEQVQGGDDWQNWLNLQSALPTLEELLPQPTGRSAAAEVLGNEGVAPRRSIIEIILRP
jgi:tetratricopeptide (TPR) repeat protein